MLRSFVLVIFSICSFFTIQATEKLLIINSYDEYELWANDIARPLILYIAEKPDLSCEMVNLNEALIRTAEDFDLTVENVFNQYKSEQPDYLLIIGTLGFSLCDRIRQEWGNVPILLVTRSHEFLTEQQQNNFTAIVIPDFFRETVDMMINFMPNMKEFVFVSDSINLNCKTANDLHLYLREEYPDVKFRWLKASPAGSEMLQKYFVERDTERGLLLASWVYDKETPGDITIPSSADLRLISSSHNPVFSLREAYFPLGIVGGIYANNNDIHQKEIEVLEAMLQGKNMQDIPIYFAKQQIPMFNFRLLKEYGLNPDNSPEGAFFYNKPESFWSRYYLEGILIGILILLLITLLIRKYYAQHKMKKITKRNTEFINNMPIPYSCALVHLDEDGKVISLDFDIKNNAFASIVATNRLQGSPYLLFPAEFIAPKVNELLRNHQPQIIQYYFSKSNTYFEFILCFVNTIVNRMTEGVVKIDVFAKDITHSRMMEANLRRYAEKLNFAINVANLIPWELNLKTNEISLEQKNDNRQVANPLSHVGDKSPILMSEYLEKVHPADRLQLIELNNSIKHNKINDFTFQYRIKDNNDPNSYEWVEIIGMITEREDDGAPKMLAGSIQVITERIKRERQLEEALEKAQESDKLKTAFLSNISHEIRTPLNAIVGFSSVIAETDDKEERKEYHTLIQKNNDQMLRLIDDIIDLAKIEANTIDLENEECDINSMLQYIEKDMLSRLTTGVRLHVTYGKAECKIRSDKKRLYQVLNHLISNACKFTHQGSISVGYEVTQEKMLYFYVSDTGVGIAPEHQNNIFDKFIKLDRFMPGVGLGLTISRNIIAKMCGEIGVESDGVGRGSTFWFTIPFIEMATNDKCEEIRQPNNTVENKKSLKILVAEDDHSNYHLIHRYLRDRAEVLHAPDGEAAVKMFGDFNPDLVLMDINMPKMNGFQALEAIRKKSDKVPVIAVTAYAYDSERKSMLEAGFDAYLAKPISQQLLVEAIEKAIS